MILIDGSMSRMTDGHRTNIGLIYQLLCEVAPQKGLSLCYEPGIQWRNWRDVRDVVEGRGINRQIIRVYGYLASRYRPGDRIFLLGYSRGAYAVRSLAGVIDRVGLLRMQDATTRNIRQAYRHYQSGARSPAATAFRAQFCHPETSIEMIGVFDTVRSLGLRVPFFWRWMRDRHRFHSHALGRDVRHGFQALARDETRSAFTPVLWTTQAQEQTHVSQMWFRGAHGDVGGHLGGFLAARGLSNIPLNWMLGHAHACQLPLPPDWRERFPIDPAAPSVGSYRGWGKLFFRRKRRVMLQDRSEAIHPSAQD